MSSSLTAYNDDQNVASINWTAPEVQTVDIHVTASGTSTNSDKYIGKGSNATGYSIVGNSAFTILGIIDGNGTNKLIGDPITVAANTRDTWFKKCPHFVILRIGILAANTQIQARFA